MVGQSSPSVMNVHSIGALSRRTEENQHREREGLLLEKRR
jgi:hypothetical protein